MAKARRKLPPELTKPLQPVPGFPATNGYVTQLAERSREVSRRFDLLKEHYRIRSGTDAGRVGLLLALAIDRDYSRGRHPKLITPEYRAKQTQRITRGIPLGPLTYWFIAYDLAQKHIRGFQERRPPGRPRGRPASWTFFEKTILAGEVCRELENGALSVADACRRLSVLPAWEKYLQHRSWVRIQPVDATPRLS